MRKSPQKRRNIAAAKRRKGLDSSRGIGQEIVLDGSQLAIFQQQRRGPGRPKRHDLDDLLTWRNRIVWFLESNWPELKPALRRPRTVQTLRDALEPYKEQGPVHFLMATADKLFDFLRSGRYHGDPRQIASAIAGADTLSWRRSLDICGAAENRCKLMVHQRAWRDLVDRKFHDRFLLLRPAEQLPEADALKRISVIMRGTRTHDENVRPFRERAGEVLEVLRAGKPRPRGKAG